MLKAIGRNVVLFAALAIGAVLCALAAKLMMSERGAYGPAVLQSNAMLPALLALIFSLAVAVVLGVIVGRVANTVVGLFAAGGSLYGLAWGLEPVAELAHSGSLGMLVVEQVVLAGAALVVVLAVFKGSGPLKDVQETPHGVPPHPLLSVTALKLAAAGVIMIPLVWLLAQNPSKGQALGAVIFAAVGAGLAGRLLAPTVQPVLIYVSPLVFGAVGYLIGMAQLGSATLLESIIQGTEPSLLMPMPVDYLAGTLIGVSIGLGWAKSFVHEDEPEPARATQPS